MLILPALPEFLERYPDIQIDLGVSDRRADLIEDNIDCVIRGGDLADSSLIARRLSSMSWCTCATPDYLERYDMPRHPRDIDEGHLVVSYFSSQTGRPRPFCFRPKGSNDAELEIEGRRVTGVNDSNAHLAAGLAGLGIIQTPCFAVRRHIERGELIPILEDWDREPLPVHILYPPNRHLSTKVRVFIDWVAALLEATP